MESGIQLKLSAAKAIDGWMSDSELDFLAKTAKDCERIIEVGSHKGRSSRALADNCKGYIYCIDPWEGNYLNDRGDRTLFTSGDHILSQFIKNLQNCPNVVICRGGLVDFSDNLPLVDFIFLDGDHHYELVKQDILLSKGLLKRGGILAGHDYTHTDWPGVKKAVDELVGQVNLVGSIWFKRMV